MAVTFHAHRAAVLPWLRTPHNLLCPPVPLDCTRRTALIIGGSRCGSVRGSVLIGEPPPAGGHSVGAPPERLLRRARAPKVSLVTYSLEGRSPPAGTLAPRGASQSVVGERGRNPLTHPLTPIRINGRPKDSNSGSKKLTSRLPLDLTLGSVWRAAHAVCRWAAHAVWRVLAVVLQLCSLAG